MNTIDEYLTTIPDDIHQQQLKEVFDWIRKKFPSLEEKIAWKQPMFLLEGTFIIGFSASQQHFSVSPEKAGIMKFSAQIKASKYSHGSNLFRIKWNQKIDFQLLEEIILNNMQEKSNCKTFWRS